MEENKFCGLPIKTDIYDAVRIDLSNMPTIDNDDNNEESKVKSVSLDQFDTSLQKSLVQWIDCGKRSVWFRVPTTQSHFIPTIIKNGFQFHHAKSDYVMLLKWIKPDEIVTAPNYAHTMVGVGGLVYNPITKKVLLIQEKRSIVQIWKFPGGYVEHKEDISDGAIREVFEETGIKCKFISVLLFRHIHRGAFDCSDIYFVCLLQPIDLVNCEWKKCDIEIENCRWFELDEANENLCGLNKYAFQQFKKQFKANETSQGQTINSEMIQFKYGHIQTTERVYTPGSIETFVIDN